jgi:polyhydroxybutyrate depolymerase
LHFNLTGEPGLQNDITMVGALLDHIEATMCIDPLRVYATGMSDGGAMTSVLACESDRFAAFGAVTLVVLAPGCAARPVAIVAFSGTADPIVPFNGGTIHCCGNASIGAAPTTMAGWAAHDGCGKAPIDVQLSSEVDRRTWTGCSRGTVVFYIIDGGGHTWPGAIPLPALGLTTTQIDATSTIWNFFKAHPLP